MKSGSQNPLPYIHCVQAVLFAQLSQMQPGEPSATICERVIRARNIQTERFSSLALGERQQVGEHAREWAERGI